jgi:hypothetical protein
MPVTNGKGKGSPKISDADFIKLFPEIGGAELARRCGVTESNVMKRRRRLEERYQTRLAAPGPSATPIPRNHPERVHLKVTDGIVLVGSDAHYWPGEASVAHRAFVKFTKDFKPQAVIMNGDAFDGSSISRHPPIGWTRLPTVQEEIEACQERLHEILVAKPMKCRTIWTLGNHDQRLETRIATVAPEFAKVAGTSLKDHFPTWEPAWAAWINGDGPDGVVVKHRFKGGTHSPFLNTMWAGRSIVTGHLHSAKVYPFTDYNGTRYGIDTGCLADTSGQQFTDYSEDNAKNWRSGFAVLTFIGGKLLMPELVLAWDENHVQWRGNLIRI